MVDMFSWAMMSVAIVLWFGAAFRLRHVGVSVRWRLHAVVFMLGFLTPFAWAFVKTFLGY